MKSINYWVISIITLALSACGGGGGGTADTTPPVMSLNGAASVDVYRTGTYTDLGVTVTDNVDTGLSATVTGTVNTAVVGVYTLTYSVSDAAGNAAIAITRTVNVIADITPPVIALTGASTLTVAHGSVFTDIGTTVTDNFDVGLTATTSGNVNTATVGSYTLTYDVSDAAGNVATSATRTVNVTDQTAPVITLNGPATVTVAHGSVYADAGATVSDNVDVGLVATATGTVSTSAVGTYTITYNVSDAATNAATSVTRTVNVIDQTAPVITLNGAASLTVAHGFAYTDAGATVSDNVDSGLIAVVSGSVNTSLVGTYTLTYNVSDAASNAATAVTRTVSVTDQTVPVINLTTSSPMSVILNSGAFVDPVTITDNVDSGLSPTVTGAVNMAVAGSYNLTYNATDIAGNTAAPVNLTVNVILASPVPTMAFDLKKVQLSWPAVAGANHYRVLANPTTGAGFTLLPGAGALTATSFDLNIPVHLTDWMNAQFLVEACDALEAGCGSSTNQTLTPANSLLSIGYVKPHNPGLNNIFGEAVAISGDGNTLAIGSRKEDSSTTGVNSGVNTFGTDSGAVYIFNKNGAGVWSSVAHVKASNTGISDSFGISLSLNFDGSTLAVGSAGEDGSGLGVGALSDELATDAGAVYVFTKTLGVWSQQAYVKASNTGASDFFGVSVSLSDDGNTLAVGADREDTSAVGINAVEDNLSADSGAVYVFTRSVGTWSQQAFVKPSTTHTGDYFGSAVSLSGDGTTLAVGAKNEDSFTFGIGTIPNTGASNSGAVFVYTRTGTVWSEQEYIKANNTGATDVFGSAVTLSTNGNTLVVAAPREDFLGTDSGAAYVFVRNTLGVWSQQTMLKASNAGLGYLFGSSVSISGDGNTLAVGQSSDKSSTKGINSTPNTVRSGAGAVLVFTRTGSAWTEKSYVKSNYNASGAPGELFGTSVSISADGQTLLVGAPNESSGATGVNATPFFSLGAQLSGAAFLY